MTSDEERAFTRNYARRSLIWVACWTSTISATLATAFTAAAFAAAFVGRREGGNMKVPYHVGPGESWTEDQLNAWLRKMERWHLISKTYIVENGQGDWYYWSTTLGVFVLRFLVFVLRFLEALTKLKFLKASE